MLIQIIPTLKIIHDPVIAFLVLTSVTALILFHTIRYKSQALTSVALILSYLTLFLTYVSLYTYGAGLVLTLLVSFFAFRFRWLWIHLFGVILLFTAYGVWGYLAHTSSDPSAYVLISTDQPWVSFVFLMLTWFLLKIPDFSEAQEPKIKEHFIFLIGVRRRVPLFLLLFLFRVFGFGYVFVVGLSL